MKKQSQNKANQSQSQKQKSEDRRQKTVHRMPYGKDRRQSTALPATAKAFAETSRAWVPSKGVLRRAFSLILNFRKDILIPGL
ncbi:MAG: hypothetical protein ACYST5_03800 [Planctomycetota bacterium]